MGALLEMFRESSPEDIQALAEMLQPYFNGNSSQQTAMLNLNEFQVALSQRFGITKRREWLRHDLFEQWYNKNNTKIYT